jgi:hypothetical protein
MCKSKSAKLFLEHGMNVGAGGVGGKGALNNSVFLLENFLINI